MKTVCIAGATGYLGRYLVSHFKARGWHVRALVRDAQRAVELGLDAHDLVEAEATNPVTLAGAFSGVDVVVSALGVTRQKDGLSYDDVDFGANRNLLIEAVAAGVSRFGYIHVLNGYQMTNSALARAKTRFVALLQATDIASTVIAPSGYFSDMADFLNMARSGRIYLFGSGHHRINPIHGADLADATIDAMEAGRKWLDVGGPEVYSHFELAQLAFATLGKSPRITRLPDALRTLPLAILPYVSPLAVYGPIQFFLTAMGMDMVGEPSGTRRLADHFKSLAQPDN